MIIKFSHSIRGGASCVMKPQERPKRAVVSQSMCGQTGPSMEDSHPRFACTYSVGHDNGLTFFLAPANSQLPSNSSGGYLGLEAITTSPETTSLRSNSTLT